jgi:hypothetical protein
MGVSSRAMSRSADIVGREIHLSGIIALELIETQSVISATLPLR